MARSTGEAGLELTDRDGRRHHSPHRAGRQATRTSLLDPWTAVGWRELNTLICRSPAVGNRPSVAVPAPTCPRGFGRKPSRQTLPAATTAVNSHRDHRISPPRQMPGRRRGAAGACVLELAFAGSSRFLGKMDPWNERHAAVRAAPLKKITDL